MATTIPIFKPPKSKKPSGKPPSSGGSSSGGSSSGGSSSGGGGGGKPRGGGGKGKGKGGGGGGGGGGGSYEAKAANKNVTQAKNMEGQIKALKLSLSTGFAAALKKRLANIQLVSGQQDKALVEGYYSRLDSLKDTAADNERAAGDASAQNVQNRTRERTNAVTEALNMGAGESDVLRSSMMSLRSWDANQGEINRSYFDSLSSLNSSKNDLFVDTKTARLNMQSQANADRDQVWSQYYDQRSETFTNLGNAYGMQGELYGLAQEAKGSKKIKAAQNKAVKGSDAAFLAASKANAQVWKNPGNTAALTAWQGQADFAPQVQNSKIQAAPTAPEVKKPEGASLRKWTV